MKVNRITAAVAGVLALAAAGSAFANTSLEQDSDASIFLNVVDQSKGTSYLFDTGLKEGSFTGTSNYSTTLADANWTAFQSSLNLASDSIYYNVVASTDVTTGVVLSTSSTVPVSNPNGSLAQATAFAADFIGAANGVSQGSTTSLSVTGGTALGPSQYWEFQNPSWVANITATDTTSLGSSVAFWKYAYGGDQDPRGSDNYATTKYAGLWTLTSGGALSYAVSQVPLPASGILLLSAVALMGLIARRRKTDSSDSLLGGAIA